MDEDDTTDEDDELGAESDKSIAEEERKFKKYFGKKQYNVIESYFEEGASAPWYLRWHSVRILIEEPHFHKSWSIARQESPFSLETPDHEKRPDGPEPDDSEGRDEKKARDDRIARVLVDQIEFEEEVEPIRRLRGRGRILDRIKIGIFNLKEGEMTVLLGGFEEVEINIHENVQIGRIMHNTGDLQDRDDTYLFVQGHVQIGTLDTVRDEYLSVEGQQMVLHMKLLLWECDVQAALAEPDESRTLVDAAAAGVHSAADLLAQFVEQEILDLKEEASLFGDGAEFIRPQRIKFAKPPEDFSAIPLRQYLSFDQHDGVGHVDRQELIKPLFLTDQTRGVGITDQLLRRWRLEPRFRQYGLVSDRFLPHGGSPYWLLAIQTECVQRYHGFLPAPAPCYILMGQGSWGQG
ncbi:MAG: hypothetical protein QGI13_06085 [Rhodospirillales bacterium]|nr:hypothetical protein [Rhodospirillales bacterium]